MLTGLRLFVRILYFLTLYFLPKSERRRNKPRSFRKRAIFEMYPQQLQFQLDMIDLFSIQQQEGEEEITMAASSRQLVSLSPSATATNTTIAKKTNNLESLPVQVRISLAIVEISTAILLLHPSYTSYHIPTATSISQ